MINLNRLSALILGINRQEYRFRKSQSGFLPGEEFEKFLKQDNTKSGKLFDIFRELLTILDQLTLGAVTGVLTFLGQPEPRLPSGPGKGVFYFDQNSSRFRASEDTRPYFDAFPREGCRVYNNANINIPNNALTALTFNTERFDPFSMFTTGGSQISIVRSGRYNLGGVIEFAAANAGYRELRVRLNSTTDIVSSNKLPNGAAVSADKINVSCDYEFVAGDLLELMVFQNSGGAINITFTGNASPEFWCCRIHDQPV